MPVSISGTNGVTFPDSSLQAAAASPYVLKNRIINGAMVVDQRNAGASGTAGAYTVDRWYYAGSQASKGTWQQNAGSVTPPVGFKNYFGFTSSSAYSVTSGDYFAFGQPIEGYNIADLGWGTANAKTVTLSFQVYSSLTGTFGGALQNSGASRCYPFSYTISSANTWTPISITIAGDTTGTWLATNGTGVTVNFSLGYGSTYSGTAGAWSANNYGSATGATSVVGTNGATWYVTGVQLEIGTSATPFERRLYGQELANCQRYYQKMTSVSAYTVFGSGVCPNTAAANIYVKYPTTMRSQPTSSQSTLQISTSGNIAIASTTLYAGNDCCLLQYGVSGATAGHGAILIANNSTTAFIDFSAEL
jgi:hypothetical protein